MAFIGVQGKFGLEVSMPQLRLPSLAQLARWRQDRDEARHLHMAVERLDGLSPHLLSDIGLQRDEDGKTRLV
ncbi:DUF1127 domain-containing protein [Paragemmobacter straminiformis]|uniref:DUF1127 domain-containing protein n=1 Tax=Paragemmobacter straminiformis TaxID=2045119 RepID=A0A842I406_9RHOB|nr:DUF1127 domain-containing protein [Gemmobacter straminiformis]MBC2834255.1 DUF1127 domain-containing protein [Gemmobacter straminiformis]